MAFGHTVHTGVLEPGRFDGCFHVIPETYPSKEGPKAWTGQANFCKEWIAAHKDRPCFDFNTSIRIEKCVTRLREHPVVKGAIENGQTELSWFKRDPETDMMLKGRTDILSTDADGSQWIFDLKKVQTGGASEDEFTRSIADYGYHIQAAAYLELTGAQRFIFVAFDDDKPFDVRLVELPQEDVELGRAEFHRLLRLFAECVKSGVWPGYPPGIARFGVKPWERIKINKAAHEAWLKELAKGI
jgi:hypothetical protein